MVTNVAILERVIEPGRGDLAPEVAQYILGLDFPPSDHRRYAALAEKAEEGQLSLDEQAELDDYLSVNAFLTIIHSKARVSLRKHGGA